MVISEIARVINDTILQNKGQLANIQSYRSHILNQKFQHNTLFGQKAIKDDEEYGYHHGGRKELQFNIGFYEFGGKKLLYFGIALSFERSRDVPDPLHFFEPHRKRLNEIIASMPEYFNGFKMWHLSGENKKGTRVLHEPYPVREIPETQRSDFYVISKFADVPQSNDDPVFQEIAQTFERLFPVYWMGTFAEELPNLENRIARLCYNTNQWKSPSGPKGKSNYFKSYERQQGYGHEEWFFDLEKQIDGYHYAYLRPVHMYWKTYIGKKFDIKLYTRTPDHEYKFVGEVKEIEVIDKAESSRVLNIYKQKNWLQEMNKQVEDVASEPLSDLDNLFNVRFLPEKSNLYDEHILVKEGDIPFGRYMLYKSKSSDPKVKSSFNPRRPSLKEGEQITIREIERTITEQKSFRKDIHTAIQISLHQYLFDKFGNCTEPEATVHGGGQRIDLKFKSAEGYFTLLEIKTYENDLRTCVRTALGQLLEYSFYDDPESKPNLIIVSQNPLDARTRLYFRYLREVLSLSIGYLHFDWENNKIIERLYCNL